MLKNKFVVIILVLVAGVVLQMLLYMADSKNSPEKAVVKYARSYFMLDPSIADMLCSDIVEDENIVSDYFYDVNKKAKNMGFSKNMKKYYLYNISTRTLNMDGRDAEIQLICKKKTALNPLYFLISILFDLGETYKVDHIFNAVNEEGTWKVCGDFHALAKN